MICTLYLTRSSSSFDHEKGHESFRFLAVKGRVPGKDSYMCNADMPLVKSDFVTLAFIGRTVNPENISPNMMRRWLQ